MAQEPLDLEELVRAWVVDFHVDTNKRLDIDEVYIDINWKKTRIRHGPTEYYDEVQQGAPRTNVLLTSNFTNDTDEDQIYNLKTERRTRSVCTISMDRTYTIGYSVDIKLAPPNPVVEANAGFKGETSITSSNEETFEEELVWSVENQISVPPQTRTRADLLLTEHDYNSSFKCETKFDGVVHIKILNKRNNALIKTMSTNVRSIFRPDLGFRVDRSGIYFVSRGQCHCRFGVEQQIKLSQTNLRDTELNGAW